MKKTLGLFIQVAIVLIGIAALTFLLWEPHIEGRNAHATTFEIYFKDPFLAYVYVGSAPFFVALYRAFRLAGDLRQNKSLSPVTVEGLRTIKHCAMAIIGFVALGVVFITLYGDKEDRPAGFFMGLLIALASSIIATIAAMLARKVQRGLSRPGGSSG